MTEYDDFEGIGHEVPLDVSEPPSWALAAEPQPFAMSDEIDQIIPALVAAQAELANVTKSTQGQVGSRFYNYADLGSVTEVVRPALSAQGLLVMNGQIRTPGSIEVTTRIWHTSGQWIETRLDIPLEEQTAQKVGSALTYGRRYNLQSILGLATTDDDGQDASERPERGDQNQNRQAPPPAMPNIRTNDDGKPLVDFEVHKGIMEIAGKMTPEQRTEMTAWRTANGILNMTARMLTAEDAQRVLNHIAEQQAAAGQEAPTGDGDGPGDATGTTAGDTPAAPAEDTPDTELRGE